VLEGVIPLETFPFVEWHQGELADVSSFTVLKTQNCVTRLQCVKLHLPNAELHTARFNIIHMINLVIIKMKKLTA